MTRPANPAFTAVVMIAFATAVAGGVFRGLFSCGAYVWEGTLVHGTLATFAVAFLCAWPSSGPGAFARLPMAAGVPVVFLVARALANPFYPGFDSLTEYVEAVAVAWRYGSC